MKLSEKIQILRKNNGWSQEELADKLFVSRQSVSKWESSAASPDLDRILELAKVFGVSTDYLLREDITIDSTFEDEDSGETHKISLKVMKEFLDMESMFAKRISFGVSLCILSPVVLILLSILADEQGMLSESLAVALGLLVLLGLVAMAVAIFITNGTMHSRYDFLKYGEFTLEPGVRNIIRDKEEAFRPTFARKLSIGVALIIVSAIFPVLGSTPEFEYLANVWAFFLVIIAIGVKMIVEVGIYKSALDQLLRQGEYSEKTRQANAQTEKFASVYWPLITAAYLAWSFLSGDWHITWIIWPVAGALFAGISGIIALKK